MAWYCISFGLIARYHTVMYRCYSAPANYRVVHLVIFYLIKLVESWTSLCWHWYVFNLSSEVSLVPSWCNILSFLCLASKKSKNRKRGYHLSTAHWNGLTTSLRPKQRGGIFWRHVWPFAFLPVILYFSWKKTFNSNMDTYFILHHIYSVKLATIIVSYGYHWEKKKRV